MVFVPIVPMVPTQSASPEAQELAQELEGTIARYQEDHPRVRQTDIQQALQLARARAGNDLAPKRMVAAVAVGLALMAALLGFFLFSAG